MTGYARCEKKAQWGTLIWEIATVNHRYLELNLSLPEAFSPLKMLVRSQLKQSFGRGKVEAILRFKAHHESEPEFVVNEPLMASLIQVAERVTATLHQPTVLNTIELLQWPGLLITKEKDYAELFQFAQDLLEETIQEVIASRHREGQALSKAILHRLQAMLSIINEVEKRLPQLIAGYRQKMIDNLKKLDITYDSGRLEQEIVFWLQKVDVAEEIDRLKNHIAEVTRTLTVDEPIGRRLDFIMQEMNREANTLTSKSNDPQVTQWTVDVKVLIEQIREQVQNIE